jgi:hypothetical protein
VPGFSQVEVKEVAGSTLDLSHRISHKSLHHSFSLTSCQPIQIASDDHSSPSISNSDLSQSNNTLYPYIRSNPRTPLASFAAARKKYKPVAKKIRPMLADLPERFRIIRNIIGDPLETLPILPTNPPLFEPSGRYTLERKLIIDRAHPGDFLWPVERDLMHHFMCLHQDGFAWNDEERGHFREDFFPPIEMPTVSHKPWVVRNLPILPGIYDQVCKDIK